jgi:hypothetical protein
MFGPTYPGPETHLYHLVEGAEVESVVEKKPMNGLFRGCCRVLAFEDVRHCYRRFWSLP